MTGGKKTVLLIKELGNHMKVAVAKRLLLASLLALAASPIVKGQNSSLPLLEISADNRYFVTSGGEPFFWLGGTAWELFHRLDREEALLYLQDRSAKGFTVIQAVALAELDGIDVPNAYGQLPLKDRDPTKLNEKYFEHIDYVIQKAEDLSLYVALLPTWGDKFNKAWGVGPEIFTPENAEAFGRLLAKRYKNQNNIIWVLGGDRWPDNEEDKEIVRAMAKGIRAVDDRHLITYHPSGGKKATDYFNESWLDFDMFQTGHDRTTKDYRFVTESRAIDQKRPVINGEPRYENHPDRFKPEVYGWMDDSDVRTAAYWSMLSGAAGFTYGAHDIWQMFEESKAPINSVRTAWKEALHLPGSRQLSYMKELLTTFRWQEMVFDPSIVQNENPEDSSHIVSAIGKNGNFIFAYTPVGKPIKVAMSKLSAPEVAAYWFNPRDGHVKRIGEFQTAGVSQEFTPWSVGRGSDFVLVIVEKNSQYKILK